MPNANEDNASAPTPTQVQHPAVSDLQWVAPVADDLARRFQEAGFSLALVGGSVRDALLATATTWTSRPMLVPRTC